MSVTISLERDYTLYHDWAQALEFCRALPEVGPTQPVTFHMFWREKRRGLFRKHRPFGRKQALPVKSFFATQDLSTCSLVFWSDDDLSTSAWLRPFASRITFREYRPENEVAGTALEGRPDLYSQKDRRVWRDGDLFRILVLHNYGGVYVDMDMVLLRSLGVLLDQEFVYQWEDFDDLYNGAIMHAWKASPFTRALVDGVIELPAGEFNWGRLNLKRALDHGCRATVFPCAFFNTEWQADKSFHPFKKTPNSSRLYDGAFAWHWHNRWDDPVEPGCKFQLLEAQIHRQLAARGFQVDDPVRVVTP